MAERAPPETAQETRYTLITEGEGLQPIHDENRAFDAVRFEDRYRQRGLLGKGGMGEVLACDDPWIGREIAMKSMRAEHRAHGERRERFVREARIQGQLEHPSIVPIHDLGSSPELGIFFTMKRVHGVTLREILLLRRENNAGALEKYSRSKLLAVFRQLCMAVEYAHTRGVVHRDIKPANVMLGDFGEVYLLDWGIAKLQTAPVQTDSIRHEGAPTELGAILGTPGYMSPEQTRDANEVDQRTDIYALGAVLYEILAGRAFHETNPAQDSLSHNIPPELSAICARATRPDKSERYASVSELVRALDDYLDGDRDLQARRALAAQKAARARELVEALIRDAGAVADDEARRVQAMREVTAALAFDPENDEARAAFAQLLLHPPAKLPREVADYVAEAELSKHRSSARAGVLGVLFFMLLLPLMTYLGVRDVLLFQIYSGMTFLCLSSTIYGAFVKKPRTAISKWVSFLSLNAATLILSRLLGPLILVPGILAAFLIPFAFNSPKHERRLMFGASLFTLFLPLLGEYFGLLQASYAVEAGELHVRSALVELRQTPTLGLLIFGAVAGLLVPAVIMGRLRDQLETAHAQLALQAWYARALAQRK